MSSPTYIRWNWRMPSWKSISASSTIGRTERHREQQNDCYRCGHSLQLGWHHSAGCPALTAKCLKCNKVGHFAKKCFSRNHQKTKSVRQQKRDINRLLDYNMKKLILKELPFSDLSNNELESIVPSVSHIQAEDLKARNLFLESKLKEINQYGEIQLEQKVRENEKLKHDQTTTSSVCQKGMECPHHELLNYHRNDKLHVFAQCSDELHKARENLHNIRDKFKPGNRLYFEINGVLNILHDVTLENLYFNDVKEFTEPLHYKPKFKDFYAQNFDSNLKGYHERYNDLFEDLLISNNGSSDSEYSNSEDSDSEYSN